jgi:Circularly permutated YpsA SLOG family
VALMAAMTVERVISGGQTGADRGGLDAAIALGIPHGGWCPQGRRAEDGVIPAKYDLRESPSSGYVERTTRNIAEADATIVFSFSRRTAGPGTRLTLTSALKLRRPCLFVELDDQAGQHAAVRSWLKNAKPKTLNVAGSRESKCPGIEVRVKDLLVAVLSISSVSSVSSKKVR